MLPYDAANTEIRHVDIVQSGFIKIANTHSVNICFTSSHLHISILSNSNKPGGKCQLCGRFHARIVF